MRISPGSLVAAVSEQVWCDLQGEAAVIALESGTFYGFDGVGTRIWHMLQEPVRVSDITAAIVREYEVGERDCENDTLAFLEKLLLENLVEVK